MVSALASGYQFGFMVATACVVAALAVVLLVLREPATVIDHEVERRAELSGAEAEAA
jgi:hypothetical protein